MSPAILIRLSIIIGITFSGTWAWRDAVNEKEQARAIVEALHEQQDRMLTQQKATDNIVTTWVTEAERLSNELQKDKRRIAVLSRDNTNYQRNILELRRLLDNASHSDLPKGNNTPSTSTALETITEFEYISYAREIIGRADREALRADKLREIVKSLPCVN